MDAISFPVQFTGRDAELPFTWREKIQCGFGRKGVAFDPIKRG